MPITNRILILLFYLIVIITLIFGLWPLNLWPRNGVQWLSGQNGIYLNKTGLTDHFGPRGIVFSEEPIRMPSINNEDVPSVTIELYLEAKKESSFNFGTIATFIGADHQTKFLLAQWKKYLIIRSPLKDSQYFAGRSVPDVLPKDSTRFITITAGGSGTRFYLDGELVKYAPKLFLVSKSKSLDGRLLLGVSASGMNAWSGELYGLGIYKGEMPKEKIKEHFLSWSSNKEIELGSEKNILALYTFDEGNGESVSNHAGQASRLIIPDRFVIFKKSILKPPWVDFTFDHSFIFDFIINLLGFIPLGIMTVFYLSKVYRFSGKKLVVYALITGGIVSLVIELTQVIIPQRHSSLMDLVLNISGVALAIVLVHLLKKVKNRIYAHRTIHV